MVRTVKDPGERREEIITAAGQLFLTKGYEKSTMRDVMNKLGIAKGTIYHYFKSKEDLLDAVIMGIVDQAVWQQRKICEEADGTALERIRQLALGGSRHSDQDKELLLDLHQPANVGMHLRILAQVITKQAPLYAELISQGCDEGVFDTDYPLECAEFLLSGIQFLIDHGVYPWSEEQLERRWRSFPSLIESLLNAPEGSFKFLHELAFGDDNIEKNL